MQDVGRIDDCHHGVEARDVAEAHATLVTKIEGCRDRQRLGDARRFDQQVVELPLLGQAAHFIEQIVAQRAADAAVGHLDERLVGSREIGAAIAHQIGVDVHLAHVVDDYRDLPALAIVQHMIEQRRLAGPQKSGQHSDRQPAIRARSASRQVLHKLLIHKSLGSQPT